MVQVLFSLLAIAGISLAQDGKGMLGFGITRYASVEATACITLAQLASFSCTLKASKFVHGISYPNTPPACFASNDAYLTTAAYCFQQHTKGQKVEVLENVWRIEATMANGQPPYPKWSYMETVSHIYGSPKETWISKKLLNTTAIIPEATWKKYRDTFAMDAVYENKASLYGSVVMEFETSKSSHS